jgi:two-component system sensor histidine kinase SenX3
VRASSLFRVVVLSGTAILLVVLAVLQYKWAKQLRAATELQIGSNLQSMMMSWHHDLYGELSAICIALQVGPDSGARDAWNDYLQRYAYWNRVGTNGEIAEGLYTNPDLIRDIYIWQTSEQPNQLLRMNPNAKNVDAVAVPKEFEPLLARLRDNSSNLRQAFQAWKSVESTDNGPAGAGEGLGSPALRSNPLAGWQFDPEIPAIVHPLLHHREPFNDRTPVKGKAVDWFVVVLNLSVLQNQILPELATRHFGSEEGLEYNLEVIATGDHPRSIYLSDPGFKVSNPGEPESVMNIFGRFADTRKPAPGEGMKGRRSQQGNEWRRFSAPVWFPVMQYSAGSRPWLLVVSHRTSSVEAIARSVRRRDLVIGSIVLLLLAANVALFAFASDRAQKFAKVQMEFVASVSHELRTPLAAIFSAAENIRDGFVEGRENLRFYGSLVTSQARQLTDLVDRILLFASTRDGKTQYVLRRLMVPDILQLVRKNTAEMLAETGSTLEERVESNLPCVIGDLAGVCACLQNLISNATKYGGGDHWIGLSVTCCRQDRDSQEIRISVEDHGQGISASELPHIFEPFYRSPGVVTAQIHGTGIGLALAKNIAEAMGGRISVTSRIGAGSTFTLHLRVADQSDDANSGVTVSGITTVNEP